MRKSNTRDKGQTRRYIYMYAKNNNEIKCRPSIEAARVVDFCAYTVYTVHTHKTACFIDTNEFPFNNRE